MTVKDQLRAAAVCKRHTKTALVGELLESDRLLSADREQINKLGEENKQLKAALSKCQFAARVDCDVPAILLCQSCSSISLERCLPSCEIAKLLF
jgi:hypothetical protein